MFADHILSIVKNPAYQELNAYYQASTVFNILGLERNENRHSAFIAWLLNPTESHQLGENPLKQFLSLAAHIPMISMAMQTSISAIMMWCAST